MIRLPNSCCNYTAGIDPIGMSIAFSYNFRFDPFEQKLEPGPVHFPCRDAAPVRQESSLFQPLRPHAEAGAVPVENFHLRRTAIDEDEGDGFVSLCPELDVASQGSTVEEATYNLREAVELFLECAEPAEVASRLKTRVFVTHFEARVGAA